MAFIWNNTPKTPAPNIPIPVPPSEISYKVGAVANSVDYGGEVRYNTANKSYDVVYEFPTLNVGDVNIDNLIFDTADVQTLRANIAAANTVTLNTANISNANVLVGVIIGNAISNSSVVTKEYVDNAIAAISGGSGFDTTANIFLQKGDLLVGISQNTALRLPAGSNGQVLTVNTAASLKVSWMDSPISQETLGLSIGSHWHPYKKTTTILLKNANAIVMENGDHVSGWSNLTANITTSGAGGLDSVSGLAANTWYSVYAIYNPDTGNKALLLHQLETRVIDQNWPIAIDTEVAFLGFNATNATNPFTRYVTKLSQSFVPTVTAPVYGVEVRMGCQLIDAGNCWITLEHDDGFGNASGSVVATSRVISTLERGPVGTSPGTWNTLFLFDTLTTLGSGGRYHFVVNTDRLPAVTLDANAITIEGNTAPTTNILQRNFMASVGYNAFPGNDIYSGYGDCRSWNAVSQSWWTTSNTGTGFAEPTDLYFKIWHIFNRNNVVLPAGYTQKALIGYACTNVNSRLKEYKQVDRTMCTGYSDDWWGWTSSASPQGNELVLLSHVIPPVTCSVQLLTQQAPTGFQGPGCFTPAITSTTAFNIPMFSARGVVNYQSRGSEIFVSQPVEVLDYQRILAYQIDTSTKMYIASITF
jgi:hypothetical protein